jgi:hypothetical protein
MDFSAEKNLIIRERSKLLIVKQKNALIKKYIEQERLKMTEVIRLFAAQY